MKYINVNTDDLVAYEKGLEGTEILQKYGEDLGFYVFEYIRTNNPVIFDENKDHIREVFVKYNNFDSSIIRDHAELFFYKLKKIIFLHREFLQHQRWTNPLVIRKSIRYEKFLVHPGVDRLHVMRSLKVKSYNCLYLENIEFSEDFGPRLSKEFTDDTEFEYSYSEHTRRFNFVHKNPFQERSDYNLKKWFKDTYTDDGVSGMIARPSNVSLRDYRLKKMIRKNKGR